jgi:fumarate hydratase class II
MLVVPTGKQRWRQSLAERKTIREVVLERGHVENGTLTFEQLDGVLDLLDMTRPAGG